MAVLDLKIQSKTVTYEIVMPFHRMVLYFLHLHLHTRTHRAFFADYAAQTPTQAVGYPILDHLPLVLSPDAALCLAYDG